MSKDSGKRAKRHTHRESVSEPDWEIRGGHFDYREDIESHEITTFEHLMIIINESADRRWHEGSFKTLNGVKGVEWKVWISQYKAKPPSHKKRFRARLWSRKEGYDNWERLKESDKHPSLLMALRELTEAVQAAPPPSQAASPPPQVAPPPPPEVISRRSKKSNFGSKHTKSKR